VLDELTPEEVTPLSEGCRRVNFAHPVSDMKEVKDRLDVFFFGRSCGTGEIDAVAIPKTPVGEPVHESPDRVEGRPELRHGRIPGALEILVKRIAGDFTVVKNGRSVSSWRVCGFGRGYTNAPLQWMDFAQKNDYDAIILVLTRN